MTLAKFFGHRYWVFALCLLPLLGMILGAAQGKLGPDPGDKLMHITGEWSIRFLILVLLMSPLRRWTGSSHWIGIRRMLGLFAFFYACLHLLVFLQYFTGWTAARALEELAERPYITAGFAAWLIMLPLAITSTRAMQQRLGRRWASLHRGVYVVAVMACLHLIWQARGDIGEALIYSLIFLLLLAWRYKRYRSKRVAVEAR